MEELLTDFILGIRKYVLGISDESLDLRRGLMNLYELKCTLMHFTYYSVFVFTFYYSSMWHVNNFLNIMLGLLFFVIFMVTYYSIFEKGAGSQFFDEAADNIGALLSRAPLVKQLRGS